jgi:hypothetical protein
MSRFVSRALYLVPAFALPYMAACGGGNPSVTPKTLSSIAVTAASSSSMAARRTAQIPSPA